MPRPSKKIRNVRKKVRTAKTKSKARKTKRRAKVKAAKKKVKKKAKKKAEPVTKPARKAKQEAQATRKEAGKLKEELVGGEPGATRKAVSEASDVIKELNEFVATANDDSASAREVVKEAQDAMNEFEEFQGSVFEEENRNAKGGGSKQGKARREKRKRDSGNALDFEDGEFDIDLEGF